MRGSTRRWWLSVRAVAIACLIGLGLAVPCTAAIAEPLYLKIYPHKTSAGPAVPGAGGETVWQRADRRARLAIASVCTGCLPDTRPVSNAAPSVAHPPADEPEPSDPEAPPPSLSLSLVDAR